MFFLLQVMPPTVAPLAPSVPTLLPTMGITPQNVDEITYIYSAIDSLTSTVIPSLVPIGIAWGKAFSTMMLVVYCVRWAMMSVTRQTANILPEFVLFMARVMLVSALLFWYTNPIPGLGITFPAIFTETGREIAGLIKLHVLDLLLDDINRCTFGLEHPPLWNFFGQFVYFFVLVSMSLVDGALLLMTSIGFIAVALGQVFGAIIIPWLIIPAFSNWFWRWVNFMITYSMYRAVAAAYVFIWATVLHNFFETSVHGDYSLAHFGALFVMMIGMIGAFIWGMTKVTHFTSELFGGAGHGGAGMSASVSNFVFAMLRRG